MDASADLSQLSIDQLLLLLHNIWFELHNRLHSASTRRSELLQLLELLPRHLANLQLCLSVVTNTVTGVGTGVHVRVLIIDTTVVTSTGITVDELRISW